MTSLPASELLRRLEEDDFEDKGKELNDLASAIRGGLSVTSLSLALQSENTKTVEAALYVACETGWRSAALVEDLLPLVGNCSEKIRYRIAEICLHALPEDKRLVSAVANDLVEAPDFVKFFAIRTLLKLDQHTLATETERLIGSYKKCGDQPSSHELLASLWLIHTLRSTLSAEEKLLIVDNSSILSKDLKDPIIKLILKPQVRQQAKNTNGSAEQS